MTVPGLQNLRSGDRAIRRIGAPVKPRLLGLDAGRPGQGIASVGWIDAEGRRQLNGG